jgi:hypothetical protein
VAQRVAQVMSRSDLVQEPVSQVEARVIWLRGQYLLEGVLRVQEVCI